ncbi:MAG TPA: carbamoyl-phosphate synthase large subunit [Candidatus Binatia bacterium]|nr:carbamoyl-phosphate synthase large subunit [Candidatus Binatia bacterium]
MPKRTDIRSVLLIGSGPIVIGQACEFDYSGAQACKALREEGYRVVLVNSNPATIMTDPEFADATYIEPMTAEILELIIARERPDALLPTIGGQTGLNLALELAEAGVLERYGVAMIGANVEAIKKAEDRDLFKQAMERIGLEVPRSGYARSLDEARRIRDELGYPLILRPSRTLGGMGGGFSYSDDDFETAVKWALEASPHHEVLLEESVEGWKEFELEVMRDRMDNCVVVCTIENLDPMGVHTGDSITVAPIQTLTDKEYQVMRDAAFAIMREIGVVTGGSNVQFAVDPATGRMVVIEMNPRVSRSSALASKATGFPIAKIAAKLAVGYTLDEIRNDITRETPACFEPTIDYVVTKVPRFTFEKFPQAEDRLSSQMKSVGEVMSIGRTFKESLQKALRSLEIGISGFDPVAGDMSDDRLAERLRVPNAQRLLLVGDAFRRGWSIERVHELSRIDRWFLRNIEEILRAEEAIAGRRGRAGAAVAQLPASLLREWKRLGFSDRRLADLLGADESDVRALRERHAITPVYKAVDTCGAEFAAYTPYLYSTYEEGECEAGPSDRRKIVILGGGPNRIGQGIEFDYCCVHAAFALKADGFETIMVNCNPETVSTDYDTSDKLYFEPLTLEDVLAIVAREKPYGVIVQLGGQTPLKLAVALERAGAPIIGTSPDAIDRAEDRERFKDLLDELGLKQPPNGTARSVDEASAIARRLGYPVLLRPSYVLGGRAMEIVRDEEGLRGYMDRAVKASPDHPVLVDKFLDEAIEIDVDCVADGERVVVGGVMEHIEPAGIHSGDSACSLPPRLLAPDVQDEIRRQAIALARELGVVGLMNVQFAVKEGEVYVLEVNPRASRTVPFVSKAIGRPLAKVAARVMAGKKLADLGVTAEIVPGHLSVKESVFPFIKFPGVDTLLGPEMKSTGEVMGIDSDFARAFLKAEDGASCILPSSGTVLLSVREEDKRALRPIASLLGAAGFDLLATHGTADDLNAAGIRCRSINKVRQGSPHVVDAIRGGEVGLVVNTTSTPESVVDSFSIRRTALETRTPYFTTIAGAAAAALAMVERASGEPTVRTLQEYHGTLRAPGAR